MIMCTSQKKKKMEQSVTVMTPSQVIEASTGQRLLGANVHESLKFKEHIMGEEKSMVKLLNTRIKALKKIKYIATFKERLMVANVLFMSCLVYGIQVWGGCEEYLQRCLQVLQNRAAKVVTGLGYYTPVKELMRQTGWLSVKQLIFYHSVVMVKRVRETGKPGHLATKIDTNFQYDTRAAATNNIRWGPQFRAKSKLALSSWRWRGVSDFNRLPKQLKLNMDDGIFKSGLKDWVKQNIEL